MHAQFVPHRRTTQRQITPRLWNQSQPPVPSTCPISINRRPPMTHVYRRRPPSSSALPPPSFSLPTTYGLIVNIPSIEQRTVELTSIGVDHPYHLLYHLHFSVYLPLSESIVNIPPIEQRTVSPMSMFETLLVDDGAPKTNGKEYRSLLGKLQYLSFTRHDITYSVKKLTQFNTSPFVLHWKAVKRILRYVKETFQYGIRISQQKSTTLCAYADADWAGTTALCAYADVDGLKKQTTISRSKVESEYMSMASNVSKIVWIVGLYKELGEELKVSVDLFCESKAALQIAGNPTYHERTKHIEIDCHFIRENIWKGLIKPLLLGIHEQQADIMTKGLFRSQYEYLVSKFGVLDVFIPTNLRVSNEVGVVT
ncbi:hypothetical protein MTR67_052558 [Solanum verrucosum]|uniref:Uncharacterized protein n=1 Tax=Solanum verrucosum TaxID=315347 RepID=A0AAF0V9E2_SOLVR|nr:hypothetical protein MTR67_052558 [Solanum verrucosum]